jgi:hypothetical protein
MPQKNNFVIIATHPAFGTVTFTLDAVDAKAAFATWKQVVGSTRQWIVKRNEAGTGCATSTRKAASIEANLEAKATATAEEVGGTCEEHGSGLPCFDCDLLRDI